MPWKGCSAFIQDHLLKSFLSLQVQGQQPGHIRHQEFVDNAEKLILCTGPNVNSSHALNIPEEIANRFEDLVTPLGLLKLRSGHYPIHVRLDVDETSYDTLAAERLAFQEEQESTGFDGVKIKTEPGLHPKPGKGKGNAKELRALKAAHRLRSIRQESPEVVRIFYYYDASQIMSNIYIQDFEFSDPDADFSLPSKSSSPDLPTLEGLVKEAIAARDAARNKLAKEQDDTHQDPESGVESSTMGNEEEVLEPRMQATQTEVPTSPQAKPKERPIEPDSPEVRCTRANGMKTRSSRK